MVTQHSDRLRKLLADDLAQRLASGAYLTYHSGPRNLVDDTLDAVYAKAIEHVEVNGHLYVHVAACPCPAMQAEVARLRPDPDWSDGVIAEDYEGD